MYHNFRYFCDVKLLGCFSLFVLIDISVRFLTAFIRRMSKKSFMWIARASLFRYKAKSLFFLA